jgi:parallel beta-helix repeat protein
MRINTRLTAGITACVLIGALMARATPARADTVDEVHYTFTGATTVSLDWRGTAQDVRYGLTTDYGQTATGGAPRWTPQSSAGPFWQAQIDGLSAGATYHYSIGGSADHTFHTPPTGPFVFDAVGDIGDTANFSHLADTLSAVASDQPSFVIMDGDLSYAEPDGQSAVDQHFNDVMAWSTSAAYVPAWGNHEWEDPTSDDLRNYKGRLQMANAQASPGSPDVSCCGDDWGWFDAGGVRFIAYPEPWPGAWADWQTKASQLMSEAQSDPSIKYVVTFGHRPAYSTGFHPGEAALATILDSLGSTYSKYVLDMNGHSHDYERFQPIDGVTHITVGSSSSVETPWSSTDPRSAVRAVHLMHLRVEVGDSGLLIQAICDGSVSKEDITCAPGTVLDQYTIGTPPSVAPVTAYYVDRTNPNCTDTGPGTAEQPYCTIAKGTSRLLPGQTLYVGNGTYPDAVKLTSSGTASAPITVAALPGATPVVGGGLTNGVYLASRSYVNVSGLTVRGTTGDGVYVTGCDHLQLSGLHVTGSGQPTSTGYAKGIKLTNATDSTVSGNTVDHNTDSGIYLMQGSTRDVITGNETYANARGYTRAAPGIDLRSGGNSVIGNRTHDNEDSGIQLYPGGDGNLVAGNLTYRNGDHGIDDYGAANEQIVGNSVYANTTAGINLEGGSTGGLVENNVSVDNGLASPRTVGDIRVDGTAQTGTAVDYNLVYLHAPGTYYVWGTTLYTSLAAFRTAAGQEQHGKQADPRWANPDTADFRLTAGSPAIDAANSAAPGEQDTDVVGTARYDDPNVPNTGAGPRAYDDAGAYEAPAGTTDASPQAALRVTPGSGTAPFSVTADASASTDTDASPIAGFNFRFGDGTTTGTQSSPTATHQYTTPGTYVLSVSVTDTAGLTTTTATQVVVGSAGNLVTNSNFETNLNGWAALPGCDLSRVSGGHNEGWAADLLNTASTAQTCTLNDSPNWVAKTVAGSYTTTAWVRGDATGGQAKLRLREYVGSTLVGTATATVNVTTDWQQLQISYPVASPGSTIDLNVYETNQPAGSNFLIDDVTEASG